MRHHVLGIMYHRDCDPPLQFGISPLYDTRTPSYFVAFLTVTLVLDSDSSEQKLLDGTPSLFNVSGLSDFSRSLYTHLLISS